MRIPATFMEKKDGYIQRIGRRCFLLFLPFLHHLPLHRLIPHPHPRRLCPLTVPQHRGPGREWPYERQLNASFAWRGLGL